MTEEKFRHWLGSAEQLIKNTDGVRDEAEVQLKRAGIDVLQTISGRLAKRLTRFNRDLGIMKSRLTPQDTHNDERFR